MLIKKIVSVILSLSLVFMVSGLVLCQEKVQVKCAQFPRSCRPGQPARAATDSAIVVRYSASY